MFTAKESAQKKQEINQKADESFADWMGRQETQLIISLIPQAENQDVVRTALRSAFEAGVTHGSVGTISTLIDCMLKNPPPDRR